MPESKIHEQLAKLPRVQRDYAHLLSAAQRSSSSTDALIDLRNQLEAIRNSLTQEAIDLMVSAQDILAQQQELDGVLATVNAQVDQQIATSISQADAQAISDGVAAEIQAASDISAKLPAPVAGARRPLRR